MSDIFISYARADQSKARILAQALEHHGWSVWWDPNIRIGGKFDYVIKKELDAAKCVIVLWSSQSIISEWVKDEATEAVKRGVLVPAFIENVEVPFGFGLRRIQAAWLVDWEGSLGHADFVRLLDDLSALIASSSSETEAVQQSSKIPTPGETNKRVVIETPKRLAARGEGTAIHARPGFEILISRIKHYKIGLLVILAAVFIVGIIFAVYRPRADHKSANEPPTTSDKPEVVAGQKHYLQMTVEQQIGFVRQEAQHISEMLGERPTTLSDKAVNSIKKSVDGYAARSNSLSDELWKEGLRAVFGRASQYAPVIVRSFRERGVPPIVGLYIPMVESEYRACLENDYGAKGMYQFMSETAKHYGVEPRERCNVEKIAPAAAEYIADRMVEFGSDSLSMTLVILSFYRSEESIRRDMRQLRHDDPAFERSFWTLFDNADKLDIFFRQSAVNYVPKFFAAAIVGENPEAFGMTRQPLSKDY
jgi:TIR domain-containing protein/transglycosylase-like protein with SLT domain